MQFIEEIKKRAASNIKTIVLPEPEDLRVLEAASKITKEGFANVILIGDAEKALKDAKENNLDISKIKIINPSKLENISDYANKLYELRKEKGMTQEEANNLVLDPTYFGVMMLKLGEADGLVSGAAHSTRNTLKPALQILKTAPGTKLVSAFFVMSVPDCSLGENGTFVFGDCGLNPEPTDDELSEIAISSSKSFEQLVGKKSKVAMLSFSTLGSGKAVPSIEKVINATKLVKEKMPELLVDGELQLDAAIVPEIGKMKAPESSVAGKANTLIFPDLNAGNIGYKLVERLAKAEAYGPLCQGIAKPVNDLSRGCSADDIVGVVAITAVQAISQE